MSFLRRPLRGKQAKVTESSRKGRLYLVFEYIEKNLLEVLEENNAGIDPRRLRQFVYQMVKGVTFLDSKSNR